MAVVGEAEMLAEEGQHMILESVDCSAGVGAGINFATVGDAVAVEGMVKLGGDANVTIFVADCRVILPMTAPAMNLADDWLAGEGIQFTFVRR